MIAGHQLGIPSVTALAAAMLSERDIIDRNDAGSGRGSQPPTRVQHDLDCDVTERVEALQRFLNKGDSRFDHGTIRPGAARQVARAAEQFIDLMKSNLGNWSHELPTDRKLSQALLSAMPDRLAKRRDAHKPRGLMVGGRGVKLDNNSSVRSAELFLCVDVDAGSTDANVRQASSIERDWLPTDHLKQIDERFMHPTQGSVVTRRRTYWLDLLLDETPVATVLDDETAAILAKAAAQAWHKIFPTDDKSLNSFLGRARWLSHALKDPAWPDVSDSGLQSHLGQWCAGQRDLNAIHALPWRALIEQLFTRSQLDQLAREAPESFSMPGGRSVLLTYEADRPPVLAARIQEFFGMPDTPRIAGGRVPLTLHLLAPNGRCQQITDDLASFWKNTYSEVRKQLRGRYPKHAWPEDPSAV